MVSYGKINVIVYKIGKWLIGKTHKVLESMMIWNKTYTWLSHAQGNAIISHFSLLGKTTSKNGIIQSFFTEA